MAEGRYYWLKLKRDFFKRHDITILEAFPNGKEVLLLYIKLLCESVDHDGRLRFSDEIPYTAPMLAAVTRTNPEIVESAMEIFRELGLLEVLEDGTIYMTKVTDMVGSETADAKKKREQRERSKDKQGTEEGHCPDIVPTLSDRDKSIEFRDKSIDSNKAQAPREDPAAELDPAVREAFRDYEQMRVKIKAAMTDKAKAMEIDKLKKLASDPAKQVAILNQSTMNSWKGLYELKEEKAKEPKNPPGTFFAFQQRPIDEVAEAELEKKLLRKGRNR